MTTKLSQDWREFFEALQKANVEFVVVGALAVSFHAEPRETEDIDVLIRPTTLNGRRLKTALALFGFTGLNFEPAEANDPDRVWMLGRKPFRIDILTSINGVSWAEVWKGRVLANVDGIELHLIGRAELIKNKRAAGRDKDLRDVISIERIAAAQSAEKSRKRPPRR